MFKEIYITLLLMDFTGHFLISTSKTRIIISYVSSSNCDVLTHHLNTVISYLVNIRLSIYQSTSPL